MSNILWQPTPLVMARKKKKHARNTWQIDRAECWCRQTLMTTFVNSNQPSWHTSRQITILVGVSTHLKNISQNGNLPHIGVNIKNIGNHHLVKVSLGGSSRDLDTWLITMVILYVPKDRVVVYLPFMDELDSLQTGSAPLPKALTSSSAQN